MNTNNSQGREKARERGSGREQGEHQEKGQHPPQHGHTSGCGYPSAFYETTSSTSRRHSSQRVPPYELSAATDRGPPISSSNCNISSSSRISSRLTDRERGPPSIHNPSISSQIPDRDRDRGPPIYSHIPKANVTHANQSEPQAHSHSQSRPPYYRDAGPTIHDITSPSYYLDRGNASSKRMPPQAPHVQVSAYFPDRSNQPAKGIPIAFAEEQEVGIVSNVNVNDMNRKKYSGDNNYEQGAHHPPQKENILLLPCSSSEEQQRLDQQQLDDEINQMFLKSTHGGGGSAHDHTRKQSPDEDDDEDEELRRALEQSLQESNEHVDMDEGDGTTSAGAAAAATGVSLTQEDVDEMNEFHKELRRNLVRAGAAAATGNGNGYTSEEIKSLVEVCGRKQDLLRRSIDAMMSQEGEHIDMEFFYQLINMNDELNDAIQEAKQLPEPPAGDFFACSATTGGVGGLKSPLAGGGGGGGIGGGGAHHGYTPSYSNLLDLKDFSFTSNNDSNGGNMISSDATFAEAPPDIQTMVQNKDVFNLICMLLSESKLEATEALMT
jgi:hypothetical protein